MDKVKHETVIHVDKVSKSFELGTRTIWALLDVDLDVKSTDFLIIAGPSGCGKSTLLNIMIGADDPTSGKVKVRSVDLATLDEDGRGLFRSQKMGVVHQASNWVKSLTVEENVALPLLIEGADTKVAIDRSRAVLDELGILNLADHNPAELSGGEQQKISFARALVTNPWIIIADEPTGNLDSISADEVMALLKKFHTEMKKTIVLVTHNESYWGYGNRIIEMKDGAIVKEVSNE